MACCPSKLQTLDWRLKYLNLSFSFVGHLHTLLQRFSMNLGKKKSILIILCTINSLTSSRVLNLPITTWFLSIKCLEKHCQKCMHNCKLHLVSCKPIALQTSSQIDNQDCFIHKFDVSYFNNNITSA